MLPLADFHSTSPWFCFVTVFFALAIGHAMADFGMQGSFMAQAKSRGAKLDQFFPKGTPQGVWFFTLTSHCLIHAGAVWLVTSSILLAFIELVLHWLIDLFKGQDRISFIADQTLHLFCKVGYALAIALMPQTFM